MAGSPEASVPKRSVMWIEKGVVNSLVERILQSPIHAVLSWRVALLEYEGQVSGNWITTPVIYGRLGTSIVVTSDRNTTNWWKNFLSGHPATLWIEGQPVEMNGQADREDALEVARAIDSADSSAEAEESLPTHLEGRSVVQFGSYDDLVDHLSPLRLERIQTVAEKEPDSIREAARLVGRDVSDVHSDLRRLELVDVLELQDGGPNGAIQPVVPYDRIEMHIDYPLVDDDLDTDATASAD